MDDIGHQHGIMSVGEGIVEKISCYQVDFVMVGCCEKPVLSHGKDRGDLEQSWLKVGVLPEEGHQKGACASAYIQDPLVAIKIIGQRQSLGCFCCDGLHPLRKYPALFLRPVLLLVDTGFPSDCLFIVQPIRITESVPKPEKGAQVTGALAGEEGL